jgi:GPH family glycoside/pentoside/hexuronide:cation symporter
MNENESISNWNMVSYGTADTLAAVYNGIFGGFFFLFWETVVNLNVWLVAIGYTIYAIWNSVNDPLVGYFADKPNKMWRKYGKRFPLIIIGGIPSIFLIAIVFSPPYLDPVNGALVYLVWIISSSCLYELFFTIFYLSHSALYPDKFRTDKTRRKAGFFIMFLELIGTAIGFIIPPLLIDYEVRQSYTNMAWIFVIINLILFVAVIPGHRESKEMKARSIRQLEKGEKIPFLLALKNVITQKNFMVYMFVFLMDGIIGASLTASIQYLTQYVLEMEAGASTLILAGFLLGALGSLPLWLFFSQKINNNRKMLIIGVFLNTILLSPFMFVRGYLGFIIAALLLGIGGGALRIGRGPVFADTIDEATVKLGKRAEGAFMGVYTFFIRFSLVAQAFIFAIVHELTGFDASLGTNQTDLAKFGILVHTGLIPMILTLIALVVFYFVYDLTTEKTKEIKQKIKELNL